MTAMKLMSDFSKRYGHIISGAAQALIVAGVIYLVAQLTNVSVLQGQMARVSTQITSLQIQIAKLYTRNDAERDLSVIHKELDDHEQRIRALEHRE